MLDTRRFRLLLSLGFVLGIGSIFSTDAFSQVRIHEILSSNGAVLSDEDGDFEDWIELHNAGDRAVDLGGWGLSDDLDDPLKWRFSEGTFIGPGEYLLVWASGKDRDSLQEIPGVTREVWLGIPETEIVRLTTHPDFPDNPSSREWITDFFEAPLNVADHYGQRMRAILRAPETGVYRFWIAADDRGELYLSPNEHPENAMLIASVPGATGFREWNRHPGNQQSWPIRLEAGKSYFMSALMKEHGGGDHLSVAWERPSGLFEGPIPAEHFYMRSGEIHTGFSISASGENLVLVDPTGVVIDYLPVPELPRNISYGRKEGEPETWVHFDQPTPGAANASPAVVPPPAITIDQPRGYRSEPFSVSLLSSDADVPIRYTLDGSDPDRNSPVYSDPIPISETTVLRAAVREEGIIRVPPETTSWIFLDDVLRQDATPPEGWPADRQINNKRLEYGMNPTVVAQDEARLRLGMMEIPTLSLVTGLEHLFDPDDGVYVNPGVDKLEQPVSVELIDPTAGEAAEFQIEAGLRIRGGFSRSPNNPKHSFRLLFRADYGDRELEFPLFGDEGADVFGRVDLRTAQNYSWAFENHAKHTFLRDVFSRDTQRDMGVAYTRSRYYHLYLNGQYWGLYQTQERGGEDFAATYLGGEPEDWDVIKTSHPGYVTTVNHGTPEAWNALHHLAIEEGFGGAFADNYWRLRGLNPDGSRNPDFPIYLDQDNLALFMMIAHYTGDPDSPVSIWGNFPNNMYALFNRESPDGFKWLRHDAEHSLGAHGNYGVHADTTLAGASFTSLDKFNPATLHQRLLEHPEYRMRFADLVQEHFFNGGALTPENARARVLSRMAEIDLAIIAESARWGRGKTRDDHWLPAVDEILEFLRIRRDIVYDQFRNRGWFPSIDAPSLHPDGRTVRINAANAFYYTTDGSDPRLPGGGVRPSAFFVPESDANASLALIERGAAWRYFDEGRQPPDWRRAVWSDPDYNDDAWASGPGVLGFAGASVQNPVSTVTQRYASADGRPVTTTYFRHTFSVDSPDETARLSLDLLCDDGAVVYLNGTEIFRANMPNGTPAYETHAANVVASPEQNTYYTHTLDAAPLLASGVNVLAVEVHQANATSSDLYFDLALHLNGPSAFVDLPLNPSDTVVARALQDSEWSAKSTLAASEVFPPARPIHTWDFASQWNFLVPSHTLGGGELTVTPGPETEVEADTGGDFETRHLRVNDPLGASLTLAIPTTGYEGITLDFLTRRSGRGAGEQTLLYTVDGVNWIPLATYAVLDEEPQPRHFDFGQLAGTADNPSFAVRIFFGPGDGGTGGNNRFDEIAVSGFALPDTNLSPVLNEEEVPSRPTLIAGEASLTFDVADWFADPDGDELILSATSTNAAVATTALDGFELTVAPVGAGGATLLVSATDGVNRPVTAEISVLVNPAPFALADADFFFGEWAADEPANRFPDHMLFLQSTVSDPDLDTDLPHAYHIPASDASRPEDVDFPYAAESRSRINGLGSEGIAFINTGRGRDAGSALLALDTTGVTDIDVSWTAQTLLPNDRVYGIRLQYRLDADGPWTDLLSEGLPVEYVRRTTAGDVAELGPFRLPAELEDRALVQLQWRYYHLSGNSGPRARLRLDDIRVTSVGLSRGYETWAAVHFGPDADPALSGATASPFEDGVPNLLKYALGIPPDGRIGPGQLAHGFASEDRYYFRFYRDPELADIAYLLEASEDLIDWSRRLFDSGVYPGDNTDGEMHEVVVPLDGESRLFLRLRVLRP